MLNQGMFLATLLLVVAESSSKMSSTMSPGCEKCHDQLHHCNNKLGNLGSHLVSGLRGGGRQEKTMWEKIQREELLDEITNVMGALEERERRHQEGIPDEETSSSELPDSPSDSSLHSSLPSHPDDLEPHGPAIWPDLQPKFTAYNRIMMFELWPGNGELPREGQTLRIRWNVARKFEELLQPTGRIAGGKPWKGDSKLMGGSWNWPRDEAYEWVLHGDIRVIPGIEEVVESMRVGARVICVIPPKLGYGKEDKVEFDRPMPEDDEERSRMLEWLRGKGMMHDDKFRQQRRIAWEIELESATGQRGQGDQPSSLGAPMNLAEAGAQAATHPGSEPGHQPNMSD